MVNILLEGYDIATAYLYDELKKYITPSCSVVIIALSFHDCVKSLSDWKALYGRIGESFLARM